MEKHEMRKILPEISRMYQTGEISQGDKLSIMGKLKEESMNLDKARAMIAAIRMSR